MSLKLLLQWSTWQQLTDLSVKVSCMVLRPDTASQAAVGRLQVPRNSGSAAGVSQRKVDRLLLRTARSVLPAVEGVSVFLCSYRRLTGKQARVVSASLDELLYATDSQMILQALQQGFAVPERGQRNGNAFCSSIGLATLHLAAVFATCHIKWRPSSPHWQRLRLLFTS